jgi:hypothetical protein
VRSQPLDGSAGVMLLSSVEVQDAALHAGTLFVADALSGSVIGVATANGARSTPIASFLRKPRALDAASETLAFSDGLEVFVAPLGGSVAPIALSQAGPAQEGARARITRVLIEDESVYFADDGGSLGMAPSDGTSCALVVQQAGVIRGFAVDEGVVYLHVRQGMMSELWRITP